MPKNILFKHNTQFKVLQSRLSSTQIRRQCLPEYANKIFNHSANLPEKKSRQKVRTIGKEKNNNTNTQCYYWFTSIELLKLDNLLFSLQ